MRSLRARGASQPPVWSQAKRAKPSRCHAPCILEEGDDAAALEASLIENVARRDADEVTQWGTYTRLVREGRSVADLADTFGMPGADGEAHPCARQSAPAHPLALRQEKISSGTVRHLTMASKNQQRHGWRCSTIRRPIARRNQLKGWLFGGGAIKVEHALFDLRRVFFGQNSRTILWFVLYGSR